MATRKKQTAFRFEAKLVEALKLEAQRDNRSLNNLIETLLKAHVKKHLK